MCVLGWISRSHARNGNGIQTSGHRGSARNIEKLGFLIPVNPKHACKSWNLAWCHDMAPTWWGNFFSTNWDKLWSKLLANWSLPKEDSSFREGTWHLRVRNDIRTMPSPALIFYKGRLDQIEVSCSILELFRVHLAFLYINWVSTHLMWIIHIWTTSRCSSAPKLVEKSHVGPWVNF